MNITANSIGTVPKLQEILNADPESFVSQYPDIAAVNLVCARGLDNADEDAFADYLELIDTIAEAVKKETERCFRLFKLKPAQFHHSEAVYRIFTMEHVFRVQFNIKYDPLVQHRIENGQRWECGDSSEIFIHGILSDKRTGTCSSLPTFAIAVGRRLGYPLKLVLVPHHTLYRWDDGKETFNYQHTESGGDIRSDKYFLSWPRRWTEYDYTVNRQTNVWLHSMTPLQEASNTFAIERSCWGNTIAVTKRWSRSVPQNGSTQSIQPAIRSSNVSSIKPNESKLKNRRSHGETLPVRGRHRYRPI